ncbi:MAG TPA: alpha-amylase family protein [Saprospiraceae bacterium]|nr:alpha-amylase family protein [Saprospiraceae bacterium]
MFDRNFHPRIQEWLTAAGADPGFSTRLMTNAVAIRQLYQELYGNHARSAEGFETLMRVVIQAAAQRPAVLLEKDAQKNREDHWYLSNNIAGMSLYVDRFCGNLKTLSGKMDYFQDLGVNFLHLMPIFQSPPNESDGGYAVSDFRQVDERFGSLEDLKKVIAAMQQSGMYLMLDIVLNHTSYHHEWAKKAKQGDPKYQDYFYFYDDRRLPDQFDQTMPEIFPESAPGSFSYVEECQKWVMTVFHRYQWDLNYTNPDVLCDMLDNVFFYANLGVDILRIDAPAFIWKQLGTTCQNLPQAHSLLRLIRLCVESATPGLALLGEAIVAPKEIMKYFGTDAFLARECDVAYNATQMAIQWDTLATGDVRMMLASQHDLMQKPYGATWITYTRCHDDIGLGYEDAAIEAAGFTPFDHRKFIKDFYSGGIDYSPAKGALFSVNPKTQDARISGTLASLCGLEKALESGVAAELDLAIRRILLMQAMSCFIGGIPMLFYGDEVGYTNDYSYLNDPGKSYDNRWMHRPLIDWKKNKKAEKKGTVEHQIYSGTQKLLHLRKSLPMVADLKNLYWLNTHHHFHVAGFVRYQGDQKLICLFNFSPQTVYLYGGLFHEQGIHFPLYDHWRGKQVGLEEESAFLKVEGYGFFLLSKIDE